MNLGIVEVLTEKEVDKVKEDVFSCRGVWKKRTNWHPTNDICSETEDLESFMHYSTPVSYTHLTLPTICSV